VHDPGGDTGGARAREDPLAVPALRVRTLGAFHVWRSEELIAPARWSRRVVAALFKCLVTAPGRRLSREQAIDRLWPEAQAGPDRAAANLRATVHRLRGVLDALGAATSYLRSDGPMLVLDPHPAGATSGVGVAGRAHDGPATAHTWLDADAFTHAADAALAARDPAPGWAALDLYGGEYLPDDPYAGSRAASAARSCGGATRPCCCAWPNSARRLVMPPGRCVACASCWRPTPAMSPRRAS